MVTSAISWCKPKAWSLLKVIVFKCVLCFILFKIYLFICFGFLEVILFMVVISVALSSITSRPPLWFFPMIKSTSTSRNLFLLAANFERFSMLYTICMRAWNLCNKYPGRFTSLKVYYTAVFITAQKQVVQNAKALPSTVKTITDRNDARINLMAATKQVQANWQRL